MTTATLPTAKVEGLNVPAFLEWMDALESDEVSQGKASLHVVTNGVDYMCCLGVASHKFAETCELSVHVEELSDLDEVTYEGSSSYLPVKVANHLGIPESHWDFRGPETINIHVTITDEERDRMPSYSRYSNSVGVANLNDNGFTFKEIAAILRREFLRDSEETSDSGNVKEVANA